MKGLEPEDFSAFFKAVHGHEPFPWQVRLAAQVVERGGWPALIDLPTGAGKTAVIDIAVFHLACEADKGERRRAPLRILFVIDRRIVVDAAFMRARKIANALRMPTNDVIATVAERLSILSGDSAQPLDVVRLRGGVPQERDWARTPAQPLVAVSTVDQVGSRLLFRGYGVSPRMRPVHAGLVGADVLWLLDEVHLSRPFEETLDAIAEGHRSTGGAVLAKRPRPAPFAAVRLSATPGAERSADWFPGPDFDIREGAPRTFLDRLDAHKPATLAMIDGEPAKTFAAHALRYAGLAGPDEQATAPKTGSRRRNKVLAEKESRVARRVAVVVNRVDLAREVFHRVAREAGETADAILLTGRIRPLDRDRILKKIAPLFAAPSRPEPGKPIILVATQTIEAGADLDIDALVTEIAPLDSLRQRFGRLDRLGERRKSPAVILHPGGKPAKGGAAADNGWTPITRIYGESAYETKEWLATLGPEIDLGIAAFEERLAGLEEDKLTHLLAPHPHAPTLLPSYADLWATTWPAPAATPEPSLFLHGPATAPDVQVVWRADIDPNDAAARASLETCPPSALEAISVPIWAVQRWLRQESGEAAVADVPERDPDSARKPLSGTQLVLRWNGDAWNGDPWAAVSADEVRPGDMIVVPAQRGGCDEWGWAPQGEVEVVDLGAEAHYRQRLKGALRVTRNTLANALVSSSGADGRIVASEIWDRIGRFVAEDEDEVDGEAVRALLAAEDHLPDTWQRLLTGMEGHGVTVEFCHEDDPSRGFVLLARKQLSAGLLDGAEEEAQGGVDAITDRADSSAIGTEVSLSDHLDHVTQRARDFASRAGLDDRLIELVSLAARLHDLGKADARFQADLRGTSALASRDPDFAAMLASVGPLLAKGARTESGRSARSRRLRAAPKDFRHEALAVALAAKHSAVSALTEDERDLVLWLVGTHHGYGRPFFPPCVDPAPRTEATVEIDGQTLAAEASEAPLRLDQGWFERARRLNRSYGPWELARLEAILRLADHCASAEEQNLPSPAKPAPL